jgi:Spy/CpxP family protein refolding chaperone
MKTKHLVPKVLALAFLVTALGAAACHGGFHGGKDPQKRIAFVAHRIEKKLDLTAAQKPAFDALVTKVQREAVARQEKGRAALRELKTEVDKPTLDVDRIAALAKAQAQARPSDADVIAFIDDAAGFLKQLTPEQQKTVAELVKDKLDWLD